MKQLAWPCTEFVPYKQNSQIQRAAGRKATCSLATDPHLLACCPVVYSPQQQAWRGGEAGRPCFISGQCSRVKSTGTTASVLSLGIFGGPVL